MTSIVIMATAAFPARISAVAPTKPEDYPLRQLIRLAATHINQFWHQSFYATRLDYATPTMVPYTRPIVTPCGTAVMNNAFYCARSNSIYYDYNFMGKMYSHIGDYAVVSILAHEWGHLVQTQLGMAQGGTFTIQMELQADCLSGAYTQYAERMRVVDAGDVEEAGVGLFKGGDQIGMPWFHPQVHGTATQRTKAFLNGFINGAQKCFQGDPPTGEGVHTQPPVQPEPEPPVKKEPSISIRKSVRHQEFEPLFQGVAKTVSELRDVVGENDKETKTILDQISKSTDELKQKWAADRRGRASGLFFASLALNEALLKKVLDDGTFSEGSSGFDAEPTLMSKASSTFMLGISFKLPRWDKSRGSSFSDEAKAILRDVKEDLEIKAAHAAKSLRWDAHVDVSVNSIVNSSEEKKIVNGFEVWYVPKGWKDSKDRWKRFPQVSSPAVEVLVPGNYMMRLVRVDLKTWDTPGQDSVPLKIGGDGKEQQTVDLLVR